MMRVLCVCTGNICRSAFAEAYLREQLTGLPIEVASAGVAAVEGGAVPEQMLARGDRYGLSSLHEHRGKQVSRDGLAGSDLILTATTKQRSFLLKLDPRLAARTFTFIEFAALAAAVTDDDLAFFSAESSSVADLLVQAAASKRGFVPALRRLESLDVVDPYGQPEAVYEESVHQLLQTLEPIVAYLSRGYSSVSEEERHEA